MYLKFFVLSLSLSFIAQAASPELAVRKFIRDKYFKGEEKTLSVIQDKNVPIQLYRVRPMKSEGGWTVMVDENGESREADKTSFKSFLGSLEKGLTKLKISKDSNEAVKISNGLINHLTSARRNVKCAEESKQLNCELSILEGEFAGQKASLKFAVK